MVHRPRVQLNRSVLLSAHYNIIWLNYLQYPPLQHATSATHSSSSRRLQTDNNGPDYKTWSGKPSRFFIHNTWWALFTEPISRLICTLPSVAVRFFYNFLQPTINHSQPFFSCSTPAATNAVRQRNNGH